MFTPNEASRRTPLSDDAIAWALAASARPHLSRPEADHAYISIGIGETFEAIDALLTAIARNRIPVSHDVLGAAARWLDCHRGRDAHRRLSDLLAQIDRQRLPPGSPGAEGIVPVPVAHLDEERRAVG